MTKTSYRSLKKRIDGQIKEKKLLCDIKLADKEFEILSEYASKCISGRYRISGKSAPLAVFLAVCGKRFYDGVYWEHVEDVCGVKIPYKTQAALGDAFFDFAISNGVPVFSRSDRVKNIMAQCFLPAAFEKDMFRFLFYRYFIDLRCDITKLPKTLDEKFLQAASSEKDGERMSMITRGTRDFISFYPSQANRRMRHIIGLMDKLFHLAPLPLKLTELDRSVIEWCENDETFRRETKNANFGGHINRSEAFSSPFIEVENGEKVLWLPAQFFRYSDGDGDNIIWFVDGERAIRPAATLSINGIQTEAVKIRLTHGVIPGEAAIAFGGVRRSWKIASDE